MISMIEVKHYDIHDGTLDLIHTFEDGTDRTAVEKFVDYLYSQDHGTDSVYYTEG